MSFDLLGINGGSWSYNNSAWFYCLKIAQAHGWEPLGTRITEHNPELRGEPITEEMAAWRGGYSSIDWQTVTDEDAKALAAALDRALGAASYAEDERQVLTELADLARRGPFLIG
jgi:hypothetical protein